MIVCLVFIALLAGAAVPAVAAEPGALAHAADLVNHGRYAAATELVDRIEREAGSSAVPSLQPRLDIIRGDIATDRGDYKTAFDVYNRALDRAKRASLVPLALEVLDRIALAYSDQGEWVRALEYATRALEENPAPDDWARARHLYWRGMVSLELKDPDASEKALREGLTFAERTPDLVLVGNLHRRLCILYWRLKRDRVPALRECDEGLAYARRAHSPRLVVNILNNSANVFRGAVVQTRDDQAEALRRYQEGLATARRDDVSGVIPVLLKNIGVMHRQLGRFEPAARALKEAVREADAIGLVTTSWQAREELAQLVRDRDPTLADRALSESLDVLEGLNAGFLLEDFRAGALAGLMTIGNPYDDYIDLLLAQHQPDRAFLVAERFRARSFLDTLSQARDQVLMTIPPAFVVEERQLLQRISERQLTLRTGDLVAAARANTMAAIEEDEHQLERLHLRLSTDHPAAGQARFPHLWTVEELQQRILGRDDAIVAFSLRKERSTAWVIRSGGLDVVPLPDRAAIEAAVRPLLAALQNPRSDARAAAKPLEAMLAPVVAIAGGARRLIVVPQGILSYVPFDALAGADGTLLVEQAAISYAPSASSYAFLRTQPPPSGDQVVAVGNPVVRVGSAASARSAAIERIGFLEPLPSTSDELRAIARLFPGASHTFEQARATEAALAGSEVSRAAIVHFATHGVIDEMQPQRSGLALTAVPPASDGILQMREIYGLKLHAALVTLSACQTALGKDITGEGVIGMARAFFYAGANAVMASLWNVDDASTAQLMGDFYQSLRDGAPIDEAARQAKRVFVARDPRFRHPYYWAGFIVSGNPAVPVHIVIAPFWRRALPLEGAAFALSVLGCAIWRFRAGHRRRTAPTHPVYN